MKSILRFLCAILAIGFVACSEPDYGSIPDTTITSLGTPDSNNEIWFITTDGKPLLSLDKNAFDAKVVEIINSEYGGVNRIVFDSAVKRIGANAFNSCHNIFNISLPNSVEEIGERAFYDCINMECLTIGTGLKHCYSRAFDGCFSLHSLHIPAIYNWCKITFDSPESNPTYYSGCFFIDKTKIKDLNIPSGIESISRYAFYNNSAIESVDVASSVKSFGRSAFHGCEYIEKVTIHNVKSWCEITFENEEANPLSIAEKLHLKERNGEKDVVSELHNIEISGVTNISPYTFINCTSIKSFIADNALTAIGTDAFRNCTSLGEVLLGEGISEIGGHCFMNCKELKSVTCMAHTPPTLGNDHVFEYNHKNRKFYVPSIAVEAYKVESGWKKYAGEIEGI